MKNHAPQRLPGFTAEASLRTPAAAYRAAAAAGGGTKQKVVPAAPVWWCRIVGRACQLSGIGCEAWGACIADL